eukprot:7406277-Lingulodinium_polyedra.AAC.1
MAPGPSRRRWGPRIAPSNYCNKPTSDQRWPPTNWQITCRCHIAGAIVWLKEREAKPTGKRKH